jgi:Eukaryotic aspartyl protease
VSIGSVPDVVTVQLDTGSSQLWVNPNCVTAGGAADVAYCNSLKRYDPTKSATSKNLGIPFDLSYGSGEAVGFYYTDDIMIGSGALNNQEFGVASDSRTEPFGILGIGPHTPDFDYPSVIENLAAQKQINSVAFSLDLHDPSSPGTKIGLFY